MNLKQEIINISNFNPNDINCKINSPRSIEAMLRCGIVIEDLYKKEYKKIKQTCSTPTETKAL
jgi:uncharacterized membrane protein